MMAEAFVQGPLRLLQWGSRLVPCVPAARRTNSPHICYMLLACSKAGLQGVLEVRQLSCAALVSG